MHSLSLFLADPGLVWIWVLTLDVLEKKLLNVSPGPYVFVGTLLRMSNPSLYESSHASLTLGLLPLCVQAE